MNEELELEKNTYSEKKSYSDFMQDKVSFLDEKFKKGIIDKDTYNKLSNELKTIIENNKNNLEKLKTEYESKKQDIITQTGEKIKEGRVGVYQEIVYKELGIDKITYNNSILNRFKKGVVDSIIVGNIELVAQIIKEGINIFLDLIKNLFTIEGIKEILKSIGASIRDLFFGDSYEKGKSFGDLGLATIGGGMILKVGKEGIKKSITRKGKIENADVDFLDNKDITQVLVENDIKKTGCIKFFNSKQI